MGTEYQDVANKLERRMGHAAYDHQHSTTRHLQKLRCSFNFYLL